MNLKIILENKALTIELKNNQQTIDSIHLNDINNLSKILLSNIDLIIRRNGLKKDQIKRLSVESNLPDSYTSGRIAKSLEKSYNFALKGK